MTDLLPGTMTGHAGELALAALRGFGVDTMFTLNGGHIWPLYDAAVKQGVRIVDTRHEQSATFAAEAWAKLTRTPGLAVLTAGPGVTNGVSAITTAHFNGSPVVVLGGRAPQGRWGSGSLQELDHVPIVASITKDAATLTDPSDAARAAHHAATVALTPHRGPTFLDLPMDVVFAAGTAEVPAAVIPVGEEPDPDDVAAAAALIAQAERPAIIVGSDVYWDGAWDALARAVESLRVPCWFNGLGRGCLPADHELAFTRTRGLLKTDADLVVVIGTALDFRLGFGRFGTARVVHVVDSVGSRSSHASVAAAPAGDLGTILDGFARFAGARVDHEPWIAKVRDAEKAAASGEAALLAADADPNKPTRIYGELVRRLARDAVVICDGGDFASYAGKYVEVFTPGCWLDTGPYGCLGNGPGYAAAARVARPSSQVVVLLGDGAAGFSLMEADTLVRHGLGVVMVVGNNGIWGLEKHPMQALFGYDVVAELSPGIRYDRVIEALGGHGELVTEPGDLGPALDRAFTHNGVSLVNVLTDPADAYPRSSNLA
jgi:acetolactate synthase-1/2/3 large subunit